MGWRFRKSINIGMSFRVNISKNGIVYSWGVPGYRKTWKANGGTRTTYSIPGTGISYVEDKNPQSERIKNKPKSNLMERYNLENTKTYPVVNGKIDAISTPENGLFIDKIKEIKSKNFKTWMLGLLFIIIWCRSYVIIPKVIWIMVFFTLIILVLILVNVINSKRTLHLEYDIDEEVSEMIKNRNKALECLSNCDKIWNIEAYSKVSYTRVNAGCGTNVNRNKVYLTLINAPSYLKMSDDEKFYQLTISKNKYLFLPDKILVESSKNVGALGYHDISISLENTNFVETESEPTDSTLINYTWKYVNNNGTPDRRFNDNRQLPVYAYMEIAIKSETGLNLRLLVSSDKKAKRFKEYWDKSNDLL